MNTARIIGFFCEALSRDDIKGSYKLTSEFGFEPIDIARLVIASEDEYNITIHDECVSQFNTVEEMAGYILDNLPEPEFDPEQLIYESAQTVERKRKEAAERRK